MDAQNLLPNLDPDNKEFLRRLNGYFCEEIKDATDLNSIELMWYLRTVLIGYEEVCDALREMYKPLHLSHGLTLQVTPKHKLLCFNPNDSDRAAREMWLAHGEERLRENVRLRLITKGD